MCNPLFGTDLRLATNGSSSERSTPVSGHLRNGSPFIGSGSVRYEAASFHSPPTRFAQTAGDAADIVSGSNLAQVKEEK